MAGLGMSSFSMFSSSSSKAPEDQAEKAKNPLENMDEIPQPKKEDTQLPNRPVKVGACCSLCTSVPLSKQGSL